MIAEICKNRRTNKEIPIHNGTHKGGSAAEGGPPTFEGVAEGRPHYGWVFLYSPNMLPSIRGSYLVLRIGLNHLESRLLASLPACLLAWLPACLAGCLVACLPACLSPGLPGALAGGFCFPPLEITLNRVVNLCSKYAVKVDVDLATLQQNGRFL